VRHVVEECRRVLDGATALDGGDLKTFGDLVSASHRSSRDLYEVSLPELDTLVEAAVETPGTYGARLAGGGFGGCVTALVQEEAGSEVEENMKVRFEKKFHRGPTIFRCQIAAGAEVIES